MKSNNAKAIYKLKKFLKVGSVHTDSNNFITYKLTNIKKFETFIKPIFDIYPLKSVKYFEYLYLLKAIDVLKSENDKNLKHNMLLNLKQELIELKKNRFLLAPNIALDSNWLAGFIEGDGSFQINNKLQLVFELGQAYNHNLMPYIQEFLKIKSKLNVRKDNTYVTLRTKNKESIENLIRTLNNKLLGAKSFEFKLWKSAFYTTKEKKRLLIKDLLTNLRK